eukprot:2395017-Amphidinium_carterae.1
MWSSNHSSKFTPSALTKGWECKTVDLKNMLHTTSINTPALTTLSIDQGHTPTPHANQQLCVGNQPPQST